MTAKEEWKWPIQIKFVHGMIVYDWIMMHFYNKNKQFYLHVQKFSQYLLQNQNKIRENKI